MLVKFQIVGASSIYKNSPSLVLGLANNLIFSIESATLRIRNHIFWLFYLG